MELFSVTCITCRAKLKVRHESAIGQILPCPRCNGMVQIQPPPGWKPPVRTEAPSLADSPAAATAAPASLTAVPVDDSLAPPARVVTPAEARARRWILVGGAATAAAIIGFGLWSTFGGREPTSEDLAAATASASPSPTVAATKPTVTPTAAPISPVERAKVAEALKKPIALRFERDALVYVLENIGLEIGVPIEIVAEDLEAAGITKNQSLGMDDGPAPAAVVLRKVLTKADPVGKRLVFQVRSRSADGRPTIYVATRRGIADRKESIAPEFDMPEPAATAAVAQPKPTPSPPAAAVASAAAPVVPSATKPAPVAPPVAVASATPPAVPSATQRAAPATAPVVASPSATGPTAPPTKIDLAARLNDTLPELAFDNTPLHRALALLSQLSTIRVSYDWESPAVVAAFRRPVIWKAKDVTVAEAFAKLLPSFELTTIPVGDQLLVVAADVPKGLYSMEYAVDDLVVAAVAPRERLVQLVEDFIAPESWRTAGGEATIIADGTNLRIMQTAAGHREIETFLDRLRKARGLTPKNPATSLATRFSANRDWLEKPVSMNFRPGVPLETLLEHLVGTAGGFFTIDYPALTSAGYQGSEPIGMASDKHALADVLTALCSPREWSWRIVGERAVELTTREGSRRRMFVEFYKVPASMATPAAAQALIGRVRNQLADEGWRGLGGRGEITYDEPSQMLLVRQHQEAQTRLEQALNALTQMEAGGAAARPAPGTPPQPAATARPTASPTGAAPTSLPAGT